MRELGMKLMKGIVNLAIMVATFSVNVTCGGRYYQERIEEELERLRKHKDE